MAEEPKLPRGVISRAGNQNQPRRSRQRNVWRRYIADCGKPMSAALIIALAAMATALAAYYDVFEVENITVFVACIIALYVLDLGLRFYCKSQQWYSDNPQFWKVWWSTISQHMLTTGLILVIIVLLVVATKDVIGSYYDSFTSSWPFSWLFSQSDSSNGSTPPLKDDASAEPAAANGKPLTVLGGICPQQHYPSRTPSADLIAKFPQHDRLHDHLTRVWRNGCITEKHLTHISAALELAAEQKQVVLEIQFCITPSSCYSAESLSRLVNSDNVFQVEIDKEAVWSSPCYYLSHNSRIPYSCNPGLGCKNGTYDSKKYKSCRRS